MIDLDPQCNLTILGINQEKLHEIWKEEDPFIEDYLAAEKSLTQNQLDEILQKPHTIHFLLKRTEDGLGELTQLPPAIHIASNLDLIPGRLTINAFENKISERWSQTYLGDPLAIRTITGIRQIAERYSRNNSYDFVIIDTSPSLGALNKVIISTVDGFIIPALPDMFSLYGIRNIGNSLQQWQREFEVIFTLISEEKRKNFPTNFVSFLGYTIYNAKKYTGQTEWNLAKAHYNYAQQIPETIMRYINENIRRHLTPDMVKNPIGMTAVMHSHSTLPNMAQKYNRPIWEIPNLSTLDPSDKGTIIGNAETYRSTRQQYENFAKDVLNRIKMLDNDDKD